MSIAMPIGFSTWSALLNNFVVERAAFTGVEIGILQSLREVPGFLAFTTVFVLLVVKEQTPDSLKRSYENAPLGQKWLKYAVF